MRTDRYRILPVLLAATVALSGCGMFGDDGDDGPTGAKEAWLEGNKADAELDDAVIRLTRQCMEDKGFSIHPDEMTVYEGETWVFNPDEVIEGDGMALTLESAQVNGYEMDPRGPEAVPGGGGETDSESAEPADDPSTLPGEGEDFAEEEYDTRFYDELSEDEQKAYYLALDGADKAAVDEEYWKEHEEDFEQDMEDEEAYFEYTEPDYPNHEQLVLPDGTKKQYPIEGCRAEVNAKIFTEGVATYLEKEYYALEKFERFIWEDIHGGPDVEALYAGWSQCMDGRGFDDLDEPSDAYEAASELYYGEGSKITYDSSGEETEMSEEELDEAKAEEIKMAVAHVECDQETGMSAGIAELMKAGLDGYLVDYETELFAWYEYVTAALGTAQGLLKE